MKEGMPGRKNTLVENDNPKEKDKGLNFEVSATKAKIMALVGVLSAVAPTLAKNPDPSSPKEKDAVTTTVPDQENPDQDIPEWSPLTPAQAQEWMTHTAPADALSVEKLTDLTDILTIGAPEVFDDERTPLWTREVMRNHILKAEGGGNFSFFAAEVGGEKKIFVLTASHVDSSPIGTVGTLNGDIFGFSTNGGKVLIEVITRGHFGPGDPNSTDNKFKVYEVLRYKGINGGELDAGANDWKTLRAFPLASAPIDTTNPGYIGEFAQSGRPGPTFPNYDPALEGRWVGAVNLDPTGDQNPLTNMKVGEGGKFTIPFELFHEDSTNIGVGSSGGEIGQVLDPTITPTDMRRKDTDVAFAKKVVEHYQTLGPHQGTSVPTSNQDVLRYRATGVQPYRDDIEAAIGGSLLTEAWDLGINGTGVVREEGKVLDNITAVETENGATLPEGYELSQNYPNPFNPSTTIKFRIPESQQVTIEVFNLLGEKVATLLRGYIHAGDNQVEFNAKDLASGMYVYRIVTGKGATISKKMILMK